MALVIGDRVCEAGLNALDTECDKIYVCTAQPTTYTEATSTFALGVKNFGAGNAFAAPTTGSPSGRKTQSVAITDGSVIANGTVSYWAAVDSANSRLLASDVVTGGIAVTNGQNFTLASFAVQAVGTIGATSASGWGDHGTIITLSTTTITDDTATQSSFNHSSVRGTVAYNTGKHYFEIKIINAGSGFVFLGMMDATTANGATMDGYSLSQSVMHYSQDGTAFFNGFGGFVSTNLGAPFTYVNGDVFGVAYDADNAFYYLSKNNTWFLSGNPSSGASGTGHVGQFTGTIPTFYPALSGYVNGSYQLITGAGALTYAPPSGYTAWG